MLIVVSLITIFVATTRITRKIDKENVIEEDIKVDNTSLNMEFNTMVVCVVVLLIILVLIAIGCGIFMICKKDNPETGLGYSVAISNRLFKVKIRFPENFLFHIVCINGTVQKQFDN